MHQQRQRHCGSQQLQLKTERQQCQHPRHQEWPRLLQQQQQQRQQQQSQRDAQQQQQRMSQLHQEEHHQQGDGQEMQL